MTASPLPRNPSLETLEDRWMPSTISGFVYHDLNGNGIQDAGEGGLANVQVTLHNAQGQFLVSTTTNANGYYEFNHDPTVITQPETLVRETSFSGVTDNTLTGSVGQFDPSLGTLTSVEIFYEASLQTTLKAENIDPVGATVALALDGDMTLQVANVGSLQAALTLTETRQLAAYDGNMDFAGASGVDTGLRTVGDTKSMKLVAGANDLSAFIGTGQVSLTSTADADSSATGSGNLAALIQTSSLGKARVVYTYNPTAGLQPGNYIIREQTPTGYQDGLESQGNVFGIPGTVGTDELYVTLTSTTQNSTLNNFGEVQQAEVCGFVYHDANDNGLREGGEAGLAGVMLRITGYDYAGRAVDQSTTSAADGSYCFTNMLPGQYQILKTTQPAGYLNGKDTPGTLGGAATDDMLYDIRLPSAAHGEEYNFGHIRPASISGFVYYDGANNNGIRESGEVGLVGSLVALTGTDSKGQFVYMTTYSGADGSYRFDNLLPGVYTVVQVTQPLGYLDGKDTAGSLGGVAGYETVQNVSVPAGAHGVEYNFGELLAATPTPPTETITTPTPVPINGSTFSKRLFVRS